MVIKEILAKLDNSENPVAKILHKGEKFKVLAIGFKNGMILKEHQAHIPSKLTVLSGHVVYKEPGREVNLQQFDEVDIPVNVTHSVLALNDSLCLLTQG